MNKIVNNQSLNDRHDNAQRCNKIQLKLCFYNLFTVRYLGGWATRICMIIKILKFTIISLMINNNIWTVKVHRRKYRITYNT